MATEDEIHHMTTARILKNKKYVEDYNLEFAHNWKTEYYYYCRELEHRE